MTMLASLALLLLGPVQQAGGPAGAAPLAAGPTFPLPGVEGRIDHLALDASRERLFVAALGNDSVEVVDLKAGRHLQSVRGTREPQGILFLADQDRMVVSSGTDGTCDVYDGASLKKLASVSLGADADNLRYDAGSRRVYVAYGDGALGILDASSWKVVASIPLQAHPESFQLEPGGKRALVNVPGAREVAVVDLVQQKAEKTWKLEEAAANFPMALVPGEGDAAGLLLVGCRSPARLLLRTLPEGTPRSALELSGDVDDLFHDARRHRVYAACGAGFVDVFEEQQETLRPLARIPTAAGARTGLFVPERSQLFVAVPHRGSQPAEIRVLDAQD